MFPRVLLNRGIVWRPLPGHSSSTRKKLANNSDHTRRKFIRKRSFDHRVVGRSYTACMSHAAAGREIARSRSTTEAGPSNHTHDGPCRYRTSYKMPYGTALADPRTRTIRAAHMRFQSFLVLYDLMKDVQIYILYLYSMKTYITISIQIYT